MSQMCFLFSLDHIRHLGKKIPPFIGSVGAALTLWVWVALVGFPSPRNRWAEPTPGLLGDRRSAGHHWYCSEAAAGWPAVEFESFPTLAMARAHRGLPNNNNNNNNPDPCSGVSCQALFSLITTLGNNNNNSDDSHFTGEEPEIQSRAGICPWSVCTPCCLSRWAVWGRYGW